jgi:trehalose 6-phosphate phosphatase
MTQLAAPPPGLGTDAFLFLDFDGTLTPIVDRPDGVVVDADLAALLDRLACERPGQVAILSGRSAAQLDAMLGAVARRLAIGASHGAELRAPDAPADASPVLPEAVIAVVRAFAERNAGVLAEIKTLGAAIHYRGAPGQAEAAHALAERLAREHGLVAQRGKMVAEVRLPGSKGQALERIAGGMRPIMLGDDVTDEDAFAAARRLGGAGILVGDPRPTEAGYRLPDVAAVRAWLREQLA